MLELIGIWIRKNKPLSWILISFIGVPVFIQMHWWPIYPVVVFLTPGNHDTWIQFWGSYLGIVPSGLIAYLVAKIQIEQQERANKTQIEQQKQNDSELIFKPARPLFKLLYWSKEKEDEYKDAIEYLPVLENTINMEYSTEKIVLKNLSDKNLIGVSCYVLYDNEKYDNYKVDKLFGDQSLIFSEFKEGVKKIIVYFNTDLREVIRLTFKQESDKKLSYVRDDRFIENKNKIFPTSDKEYNYYDNQYNLNDFVESEKVEKVI